MHTSAVMVLVPSDEYKTVVPDPHCTLAFCGEAAELDDWQKSLLRRTASAVVEEMTKPYWRRRPTTNGRIVFAMDPSFNDGNRFCYADAVDYNISGRLRGIVEDRLNFVLNRGHGFTPHMTVAYSDFFLPDLAKPTATQTFNWKSVELWFGPDHEVFEIDGRLDGRDDNE